MKKQYLFRLDDACQTMDFHNWKRVEDILDKFGIKPMVGIIPANRDPQQMIDDADPHFWEKVRRWEKKGWAIALHGYDHCYISKEKGINPMWPRSEFAGIPLYKQKEKISNGVEILSRHGINPKYFFAPSHTFDKNTLVALREESDIRIISDTIAIKPYTQYGFSFIPQIGGMPRDMKLPGIWTFCLHPSMMDDVSFDTLEVFLKKHYKKFTSFSELNLEYLKRKDLFSRLLSLSYFIQRKFRGIK